MNLKLITVLFRLLKNGMDSFFQQPVSVPANAGLRHVDSIELQALSDLYHVQLVPEAKPHDRQIHADDGIPPAAQ